VPQLGAPASVTDGVCFKRCYCSCFCYVIADTLRDNELEGCIHTLPQEAHRCSPDPQAAELILIKVSLKKPVASVWTYKIVCAEDRGSRLLRNICTHPPDYTASQWITHFWCCLHCENQDVYTNNYVIFYILLTVYLSTIRVNNQPDTLTLMCIFYFSTCFEQPSAHHQENQFYQCII